MNGEEPLSLAAMSGQHEVVDFLVRAWVLQSGASSEPEDGSSLPRGLAETLPPQQIEELERLMTPRGGEVEVLSDEEVEAPAIVSAAVAAADC